MATDVTVPLAEVSHPAPGGRCGRYVVLEPLGAGGMGVVLSAYDPTLDRRVALKLLHRSQTGIEREAQAMARLAHPNVVTVFEVDRVDERTFVAMELVEGTTLRGWLAARRSWRETVDMFVAAGRGLAAAHAAGLVHRDFKPDNVLIGRDGRPRVSDFGLVCATNDATLPVPDAITASSAVGTPAYMSPEQWTGGPVDARGDQFAFCVALWEALSGRRPFVGASPIVLRAAVQAGAIVEPPRDCRIPTRVYRALRRGLATDAAERWPDLPALLDVLSRATRVRQRGSVALLAAAVAAAASATLTTRIVGERTAPHDACAVPTARLAQVWAALQIRQARLGDTWLTAPRMMGVESVSSAPGRRTEAFALDDRAHLLVPAPIAADVDAEILDELGCWLAGCHVAGPASSQTR